MKTLTSLFIWKYILQTFILIGLGRKNEQMRNTEWELMSPIDHQQKLHVRDQSLIKYCKKLLIFPSTVLMSPPEGKHGFREDTRHVFLQQLLVYCFWRRRAWFMISPPFICTVIKHRNKAIKAWWKTSITDWTRRNKWVDKAAERGGGGVVREEKAQSREEEEKIAGWR